MIYIYGRIESSLEVINGLLKITPRHPVTRPIGVSHDLLIIGRGKEKNTVQNERKQHTEMPIVRIDYEMKKRIM